MAYDFLLPDLGEGITEGEIIKWHVKTGDAVEEDQILVEVETDKAAVEIPSPRNGFVIETAGEEGDIIKVGEILVRIGDEKELGKSRADIDKKNTKQKRSVKVARSEDTAKKEPIDNKGKASQERPVLATPSTRKLARELGVDLTTVAGSGKGGRITSEDVRAGKEKGSGSAAREAAGVTGPAGTRRTTSGKETAPQVPDEKIPVRSLRRKIAEKMVESYSTIPHVTHVDEVDAGRLVELRAEMSRSLEGEDIKLTYLPFILKALIPALRSVPALNATFDAEAGEITLKHYYNIGIATATETGLMVPVVKNVDRKSLAELSLEISRLGEEARTRKIALEDLRGGTFSITNYGSVGGLFGTPIINHPETAILGIGRIVKRPVVSEGKITIGDVLYLSLSFDHRIADGKDAAEFVNIVKKYLENPNLLFLEMV